MVKNKRTKGDLVSLAVEAMGGLCQPKEYKKYIYEVYGEVVSGSDICKRIGSFADRLSGVDKWLEVEAKKYLKSAGDNYMLALAILKRARDNVYR